MRREDLEKHSHLKMPGVCYCVVLWCGVQLCGAGRKKLGITGDMISDAMASTFAFPWAIGQMAAEDFDSTQKDLDSFNA